jgi:hypothetical protein
MTTRTNNLDYELFFLSILKYPNLAKNLTDMFPSQIFNKDTETLYFILYEIMRHYLNIHEGNEVETLSKTLKHIVKSNVDQIYEKLEIHDTSVREAYNSLLLGENGLVDFLTSPDNTIPEHTAKNIFKKVYIEKVLTKQLYEKIYQSLNLQHIPGHGTKIIEQISGLKQTLANLESSLANNIFTPSKDSWNPHVKPKYSTYVSFVDELMGGGQIPGEVYGILGPFGAGKTLLCVQLACANAVNQFLLNQVLGSSFTPKHSFIFHYEADTNEMMARVISNVCEIAWEEICEYDFSKLSSKDGEIKFKKYEYELWGDLINKNDGSFLAELERYNTMLPLYGPYIHLIDMSGSQSSVGSGYVDEIVNIFEHQILPVYGNNIGFIGIDYVGLACRRHMMMKNLDVFKLRHLVGSFGDLIKQKLAIPYQCSVWLFHQLSGVISNRRNLKGTPHHTDAAEAKNFAENLTYCFTLSIPNPEYNVTFFSVTKARRSKLALPKILYINGRFNRMEDVTNQFYADFDKGTVKKIADFN